jgi:MFS family permease
VWRNATVAGLSTASFFSDTGHEMATAVMPAFLRTIGASAAALGGIEAASNGAQSFAKLAGGVVADRTSSRKAVAAAGYATTGLSTGAFALAGPWGVIAGFRALAWGARGFRSPSRDSLIAGAVDERRRGRAFGLERAMDAAGAVAGPLVAAGLIAVLTFRQIFLVSIVPGLLASASVLRLVRERARPRRAAKAATAAFRDLPRGEFRVLALADGLFGLGDFAPTLLVLRATDLLHRGRSLKTAAALAVFLYTVHNLANALSAYPAGALADRTGPRRILAGGFLIFAVACAAFGLTEPRSFWLLVPLFAAVGASAGMFETARNAYAAALVPAQVRGRAFGFLGLVDGLGDLGSNVAVGLLFTLAGPAAGFAWGATFAAAAALTLAWVAVRGRRRMP